MIRKMDFGPNSISKASHEVRIVENHIRDQILFRVKGPLSFGQPVKIRNSLLKVVIRETFHLDNTWPWKMIWKTKTLVKVACLEWIAT